DQHLKFKVERQYAVHSNKQLLCQKIYQFIAGYPEDDAIDQLTNDPVFTRITGANSLASQSSLSRFFSRFGEDTLNQINVANQEITELLILLSLLSPITRKVSRNYALFTRR